MSREKLNFAFGTNELPELKPWQEKWKVQADPLDDLSIADFHGLPELQQAIYTRFNERGTRGEMSPENVMVTSGGTEAIFTSLLWIRSVGGHVILQHPSWGYFSDTLELLDIPFSYSYATQAEDLKVELESFKSNDPVLFVLTHPSNPFSHVFSTDYLQVLSDWVHRQSSQYVLADEIYDWFMQPEDKFSSWAEIHGLSQSIIVHGYSKATGLAAYRIGYLVSERSLYKKLFPFHYSSSYGAAIYSQQLALQAQRDESDINKLLKESLSRRWNLLHEKWQDNSSLALRQKRSGMYAYIDIATSLENQKKFIAHLKTKGGVWVNPGWNFGASEGGIRLNLCRDEKILKRGLSIIFHAANNYFSN